MSDDLEQQAEQLVKAALNGDAEALKEVVKHLGEGEEECCAADEHAEAGGSAIAQAPPTSDEKGGKPDEADVAKVALAPSYTAALSIFEYTPPFADADLSIHGLVAELEGQAKAVNAKNLNCGAAMLTAQANTLNAIFNKFARRAASNAREGYLDAAETFLKLGLRAQSQCRATWEAISAIQNPPIVSYVKQANIANNQQVNNDAGSRGFHTNTRERARTRGNDIPPNKLLEQTTHEPDQWMDRRTPGTAARSDSPMETVGKVDGTEDTPR
jgi:hypothetical protein